MSKKTLLSRDTVLLRGGGRTNIEYSAGPNINITDDVISGRDWTNAINEAVESAMSGIPTPAEYSAGPNIDITDHVVSGKDWTEDIDNHIASATSGLATSADVYSAVTAISGDVVPWITGTKEITTHYLQWGEALTAFSSYDLSGTKNHHIHMKGVAYVMPNVNELISGFLPLSAFNNFVSSYSNTINDLYTVKLPWAAVQGDSATSSITGIGGSALSGMGGGGGSCPWISGGKDYGSATEQLQFGSVLPIFSSWGLCADHNHYIWMKGAYIRLPDIDPYLSSYLPLCAFSSYTASMASNMSSNWNYTNSAYSMSLSNYYNKLDISAWSAFTADADVTPYSAGNGIDITDHVISFTGSEGQTYSAGDNIDITNNVISGKSWTDEIIAAVSGKQPSGDYYSASNPSGFITSAGTVNKLDISSFTAYTAEHSGDDNQAYSAGSNINITNHVVSGKDWTDEINAATSGKQDSLTFNYDSNSSISGINGSAIGGSVPPTKPLYAGSGIEIEEQLNSVIISCTAQGGNKITYDYSTPATSYSAQGDMIVKYQTSQSTPARTTVWVADSAVGLLAPNTVNHNSFLMQDQRGSTTWVDASAVVPSSMSAQASYFSKTYTSADSGDSCIPDYPEMNRDWTFNVINWKDSYIYYSAAQGTATLAPGMGVRVHYDLDSDWLDAEPEYSAGNVGTRYLTDIDIQYVSDSAYATESGVLYIITG